MKNFAFVLDTKEVPEKFRGQTVNFETVEQLPDTNEKWTPESEAALIAQAKEIYDGPISVSAAMISVYNLQRQKNIKDALQKKDATLEAVQAEAMKPSEAKLNKRLRGTTVSSPKPNQGKQKAKTELSSVETMLAQATDPAVKAFLEQQRASIAARLEALNVATPAAATPEAPAAPDTPEAPAKGNKK